jgi:hypothetical protein
MNVNQDLLGKTITGVIATTSPKDRLREIWVLQFADGSHVEFVSPGARRELRQATQSATKEAAQGTNQGANRSRPSDRQLVLNVA